MTFPEGPETPEALLTPTTEAIRATDGADLDLLDILVGNILTSSPSENPVMDAVKAIEDLAEKRASEARDGGSNQD